MALVNRKLSEPIKASLGDSLLLLSVVFRVPIVAYALRIAACCSGELSGHPRPPAELFTPLPMLSQMNNKLCIHF